MPDSTASRTKPYGLDFFMGQKDDAGIPFEDFVKAIAVWSWMRPGNEAPTLREAAAQFNVTDAVARMAIEQHPWCFLTGPDDDPTKQRIEADGECHDRPPTHFARMRTGLHLSMGSAGPQGSALQGRRTRENE